MRIVRGTVCRPCAVRGRPCLAGVSSARGRVLDSESLARDSPPGKGSASPPDLLRIPDKTIEEIFTKARATQGCPALVLPAGYVTPSATRKSCSRLVLNSGSVKSAAMTPLKLDGSLMSQIALNHSAIRLADHARRTHNSPIFPRSPSVRPPTPPCRPAGFADEHLVPVSAALGVYTVYLQR